MCPDLCRKQTGKPHPHCHRNKNQRCHNLTVRINTESFFRVTCCEGEGDVVGVEAPLGGVAQVIFHGVQVVEVGVQVRVHENRGEEEDGEVQVEVEREVEENQGERYMCDMA